MILLQEVLDEDLLMEFGIKEYLWGYGPVEEED